MFRGSARILALAIAASIAGTASAQQPAAAVGVEQERGADAAGSSPPETTPSTPWTVGLDGALFATFNRQGGLRGETEFVSQNWIMGMATRRAGTVVQTGLHVGPAEVRPMVWAENDLNIVGTWCYRVYDWQRIAALIQSGAFPVEKVVTGEIAMDGIVPEGFEVLVDPEGSAIKILVEVG